MARSPLRGVPLSQNSAALAAQWRRGGCGERAAEPGLISNSDLSSPPGGCPPPHKWGKQSVATARSADAAALTARCHTKPSPQPHSNSPRSHHVPVDKVVKRRMVRSDRNITTAPPTPRAQLISPGGDDEGRVQSGEQRRRTASPPGASEAFAADVSAFREHFSPSPDGFTRRWEPDVSPPRIQLSIGHVAQYVLTEPEWHRKRSVATSRAIHFNTGELPIGLLISSAPK
ncbi:unnamed protein product [Pleuronectes platessa]|uniref:Uncharacterized protein n=1 Tax=Pleuronectes platessa TaxID=8262 RepID=A0A9N7ULA9_PLEPL|nr:unnamed protein product [Pleuronectes platessa]